MHRFHSSWYDPISFSSKYSGPDVGGKLDYNPTTQPLCHQSLSVCIVISLLATRGDVRGGRDLRSLFSSKGNFVSEASSQIRLFALIREENKTEKDESLISNCYAFCESLVF